MNVTAFMPNKGTYREKKKTIEGLGLVCNYILFHYFMIACYRSFLVLGIPSPVSHCRQGSTLDPLG